RSCARESPPDHRGRASRAQCCHARARRDIGDWRGNPGISSETNRKAGITRRRLLKAGIAAALAPAATGLLARAGSAHARSSPASMRLGVRPNIVVLMTDQERHHAHWPAGWVEKNLPSWTRLRRNGLYFNRAYTAASQCSPSRAVMLTGRFAPANRVTRTLLWPGLQHQDRMPNIATLLVAAGYEAVWKGKWHLSYAANAAPGNGGEDWTRADIAAMETNFGWSRWNPPDAGNAIQGFQPTQFGGFAELPTLGGGFPDNDGRYVAGMDPSNSRQTRGVPGGESAVEFLRMRGARRERPFCLFVSLVNPHDIGAHPNGWRDAGYERKDFAHLGIALPRNHDDDLSTKPSVQKAARDAYDRFAPLADQTARADYVNFYAYLHTVVDRHIGAVLDALEESGLADDTIVIRLSDHGEGGLSHGMREKAYSVYEEMIHIPLIVHNRRLFPEPAETAAFY